MDPGWTKKRPTEQGHYWMRILDKPKYKKGRWVKRWAVELVKVYKAVDWWCCRYQTIKDFWPPEKAEWSGPVLPDASLSVIRTLLLQGQQESLRCEEPE